MQYMERGSASIHYEWMETDSGYAADTIVFVHGLGLDMHSWEFVLPYFREKYDIIRYDLRGHGKSDSGQENLTVELLSDDLHFLLSELEIDSFHIVAQGFGGFIAVQLAGKKVNALKTVTLMTVPLYYPNDLGEQIVNQRKSLVSNDDTMIKLASEVEKSACFIPSTKKLNTLYNAYHQVSPNVYFQLFHPQFGKDTIPLLREVSVPFLLLSGAEDNVYPSELSNMSLNFIPNGRHYTVPRASFLIQFDQPKMMTDLITQFITNSKEDAFSAQSTTQYKNQLTTQMYKEYFFQEKTENEQSDLITVNIMNGFHVEINNEKIIQGWGKRKAKQLLVYLVIAKTTTREEICDIFWPDTHLESAKNRLRVSLHYLRTLLQPSHETDIIFADREHVSLRTNVQCDFVEHRHKIIEAQNVENSTIKAELYINLLKEMVRNPLPGLFEEWFLDLRHRVEKEWADMALFLADFFEEKKEYKKMLHYLRLALNHYMDDPVLTKRYEKYVSTVIFSEE
ncbi:alpha/beta fold hydrolase [Virgibacillus sp. W0181]|uniref:alpha/beta fold hydrolase n=1 Tax=Virgibacillus sp. W0181 TaxID=3391581 RepID=UPI003F4864F5